MMSESYAPAGGVRALSLGGRSLLHDEGRQQILELNDTADRIWRTLAATGSPAAAAAALGELGVPSGEALALAENAARQWTLDGYLAPRALDELLAGAPDRTLVLDELAVEIRCSEGCEALDAVFGHLYVDRGGARRRLTIVALAGQLLVYVERRLALAGGPGGLAAHVKAVLTELYSEGVEGSFLTHGALLARDGRRLFLSGEPGAGKTTLALALAAAGWRYGGDDTVRLDPAGAARGVPFAAAVKSGAVALLGDIWPGLLDLPSWTRRDGQQARYLLPPDRDLGPAAPLDVVVILARRPGAAPRVRPVPPFDALSAILHGGYARRWRMTGDAISALARSLEAATCVELEYSDLAPAVQAIEDVAHVPAQAA